MEDKTKKIIRRARIQDALVLTLYGVSALTLAVMAPNAMRLLKNIDPNLSKKRNPSRRMQQALGRLVSKGLVSRKENEKGTTFILTKSGEGYADRLNNASRLVVKKPKRWDRRWRIVVFDIWEKRRLARDRLRAMLKKAGFCKIQNSVWAYPYDCEELLVFIRTELRLGKSVLYIVAEGIENDIILRRHFGLPLR